MPTDYWRQMDLFNPAHYEDERVTLIGLGGIGSPVALALAKMGIQKFTLIDPDTIENHNFPNQLYPEWILDDTTDGDVAIDTLGLEKAKVTDSVIRQYVGGETQIEILTEKYVAQPLDGIVVSGVDSMAVRRDIWEGVLQNSEFVKYYIEARMGLELGIVYTVDPKNRVEAGWYERNALAYSDAEAVELPCTGRAIIYNTFFLAGIIGSQVKKVLKGEFYYTEVVGDVNNMDMTRYKAEVIA